MIERRREGLGTEALAGLTELRREMILRVVDGQMDLTPIMYHYHHLVRCDEVLAWLIRHGITGHIFRSWFYSEHKGSILGSVGFVLKQIEKAHGVRLVRAMDFF